MVIFHSYVSLPEGKSMFSINHPIIGVPKKLTHSHMVDCSSSTKKKKKNTEWCGVRALMGTANLDQIIKMVRLHARVCVSIRF